MKVRQKILALLTAVALPQLSSCVHEYPQYPGVNPTAVDLSITLDTDPSVTEGSVLAGRKSGEASCMYFVVEIYEGGFEGEPVVRRELAVRCADDGSSQVRFTETLPAGDYKVAAFAACAEDIYGGGCMYDVDDLSAITFRNPEYEGALDLKECYDARFDIRLSSDLWYQAVEVQRTLTSPMGRLEIVSTDAEEFLTKAQGMPSAGPQPPFVMDESNWEEYRVRWDYVLYFPVGYNVLAGLPNKAETRVSFTSGIEPVSEGSVLLGYDYVFVNGEQTSVSVTLSLLDGEGELINTYSGLQATLYKGRTTVIYGEYLTQNRGSGIGIDPGFDGNIDITLPD